MEREAEKEPPATAEGGVGEGASAGGSKVKPGRRMDASCSEGEGPFSEARSPRDAAESSGAERCSPPPSHDSTSSVSSEAGMRAE